MRNGDAAPDAAMIALTEATMNARIDRLFIAE
jgi:hypothetical protein